MFRRNLLLLSVLVLIFGAGRAHGQAVSVIRGRVVVPSASSDHIEVLLEVTDGRIADRTFSDSSGNFAFLNVEGGSYIVAVHLEGYEEGRENVKFGSSEVSNAANAAPAADGDPDAPVMIAPAGTAGGAPSFVTITLKKPESATGDSSAKAESDESELSRKYSRKIVQDYEKALEQYRKGEASAVASLGAVLKAAPDFYYGHNLLGIMFQKLDRYRDAEGEYSAARRLRPQLVQPLINLGSLYIQEADVAFVKEPAAVGRILDDALDILEEAVKMDPGSAAAHYYLGTAYYKSTFYEESEEHLKRALDIDAHMGTVRVALANLYMRQQKFKLALENFDAYLAENPASPDRVQVQEFRLKALQNLETGSK